ncbi:unnamed protein product, partial [Staurois parvus]
GPLYPPPHAAARSRVCHGPRTDSHHAAALGPFNLSRPLYCLLICCCQVHRVVSSGPCNGPTHCCCQARNLPWPPYRLLMLLLAMPYSVMGPCTASSCCCQVQSVSWVPVAASHCCCLLIATLCHVSTFRSPHTAGGFHFCP